MDYTRFKKITSDIGRIEWVEDENGTMVECDWEDLEELMDERDKLKRDNEGLKGDAASWYANLLEIHRKTEDILKSLVE